MAITLNQNYKCECDRCGKTWTTKDLIVPKSCPKCRRVTWIGASDGVPKLRLSYDAILEGLTAMDETDREAILGTFRPREVAKVAQPIQAEPLDALSAFIAKAQAKRGITQPDEVEPEPVNKYGWTEPAQTYDDQRGEMRTYRRHIKTGRVEWVDSAAYLSGV